MHRQLIVAIEAEIGDGNFAISRSLLSDSKPHVIVTFGAEAGAKLGYHVALFGTMVLMLNGADCQARIAKLMKSYRQVALGHKFDETSVQRLHYLAISTAKSA